MQKPAHVGSEGKTLKLGMIGIGASAMILMADSVEEHFTHHSIQHQHGLMAGIAFLDFDREILYEPQVQHLPLVIILIPQETASYEITIQKVSTYPLIPKCEKEKNQFKRKATRHINRGPPSRPTIFYLTCFLLREE